MSPDTPSLGFKPRKILKGKRVLITGCAAGIGRESARLAKAMGAHVIGVDIVKTKDHVDVLYVADLSDRATIGALTDALPDGLDGIANMAGAPSSAPAETVIKVNLLAARAMTEGLIGKLNDGAAIVNLGSLLGAGWPGATDRIRAAEMLGFDQVADFLDEADIGDAADAFVFARQALIAWTLANRWTWLDRDIRMNCVSPGPMEGANNPDPMDVLGQGAAEGARRLDRPTRPEDVAPVAAFLLSDMSRWIRGTDIPVDGGLSSHILCDRHQI